MMVDNGIFKAYRGTRFQPAALRRTFRPSLRVLHKCQTGDLDWYRLESFARQKLLLIFHAFLPRGEADAERNYRCANRPRNGDSVLHTRDDSDHANAGGGDIYAG